MNKFLLPYRWKVVGILLAILGTVLAVMYIGFNFRFTIPVFAVYSSFLETKLFTTFRTNFSDELTLFCLLAGFALIVFSKEKNETDHADQLRSKAMIKALIANTILILFSVLFVYGTGFMAILVLNLISFPVLYLMFFYLTGRKNLQ